MANDPEITALDNPISPPARPFQPSLGNLGFLPPEIRSKIWQEYFKSDSSAKSTGDPSACGAQQSTPTSDAFQETSYKKHTASVLLTSAQLYRETSEELYHHRNLSICFDRDHRDHNPTALNCETLFYTTIDGTCVPRNFCHTDFSRFESISVSVQIPPNTDLSKIHPEPKTFMDDFDLRTILEDVKRFCQLMRRCQSSKSPQHTSWPSFDVTVKLNQDTVVEPDRDSGRLRGGLNLFFILQLLSEMTILDNFDLGNTPINVIFKLRWREEHLQQELRSEAQRERLGLKSAKPAKSEEVPDEEISIVTLHICVQNCETTSGVPAREIKRADMVLKTVSCGEGPRRRFCR
ncbi:MAG: hypothetical protein L6R42_003565 [Xanthoria sp. 1 TBL-2021]|nr:MAG: hypothetical protein L6R42_003565 [Xanthoria sp. 1 TBL-2021]